MSRNYWHVQVPPTRQIFLAVLTLFAFAAALCVATPARALESVTLQLKWLHQFQFAGYYAAKQQGYYRDAGLDVKIIPATPGKDPVLDVIEGKAQYGVGTSSLLLDRNAGKPVVTLAVIFQHSPYIFITKANSASQTIHDIAGKRLMLEPQADELLAYLKTEGISIEKMKRVEHTFTVKDLIDGKVDVISGYVTNDPNLLDKAGFPYHAYTPRSEGIDFFGDILFTTANELENHPARVKAFREASLKGWQYAMDHPDDIINHILTTYSPQLTHADLKYEADEIRKLMRPDLIEIGYMNPGRWRHIAETYADLGMLPRTFSLHGFMYEPNPKQDYTGLMLTLLILAACLTGALAFVIILRKMVQVKTEELLQSQSQLKSIFDASSDAIGVSCKGIQIIANPSYIKMFGYRSAEEIQNIPVTDRIAVAERERVRAYIHQRADSKPAPLRYETIGLRKNGEEFPLEVNVSTYLVQDELNTVVVLRDITERKQSETSLAEEKRFTENALDSLHDVFYAFDLDGRMLRWNKELVRASGRDHEQIASMHPTELFAGDDVKLVSDAIQEVIRNGYASIEAALVNTDGIGTPYELSGSLLFGQRGEPIGICGVGRNISERKKATAALQASNEKLRFLTQQQSILFDASPIGIAIVVERTMVSANRTFCEMMGYPEAELINESTRLVYPSQEAFEKFGREAYPLLIEGKISHTETDFRRKDGTVFTASITGGAVNTSDLCAGSVWVFEDISDRRQVEENLRKMSRAVEQSPVTIVITDLGGTIEFVNPKFTNLTGYTAEEAVGQNTRILKSGKTSPEVYENLWSTITSGHVWEGDFLNKSKNGTLFWEHATISPLRDNNGAVTHYLAIKEDITEKRNVMEQLIQSQKVETIGQLAGGIAHDFNNILSVINGFAYLMKLEMPEDSKHLSNLERILAASDKAAELTRSLLAYSRKQVMKPVNQNLNQRITSAGSFITRLIGEHIKFTVTTPGAPLPVFVDSLQIEQVLMNLATNARDAMPNGGTFSISTAAGSIDETYISTLGFGEVGRYAVITVADTGCGMSTETMQRIFDPFYTTKEVGKGTGLGMSMVMGIIKQHKGFIIVQSDIGIGTVFTIYLPLVEGDTTEVLDNSDREPELGVGTILVAEDEPAVRDYMAKILTKYGYKVILAVDGQDAVEKYVEHKDEIDLLIFDMVMPKKSGKASRDEITQMGGTIECLFVSGYAGELIERQGELGADSILLTKPVQPHILLSKIAEILKK